jgi:hypothetical protein
VSLWAAVLTHSFKGDVIRMFLTIAIGFVVWAGVKHSDSGRWNRMVRGGVYGGRTPSWRQSLEGPGCFGHRHSSCSLASTL